MQRKREAAKRANSSLQAVATLIVALEVLVRDFAGWGTQFPDAQREAKKLLDASPLRPRVWLINEYLYRTSGITREYARTLAPFRTTTDL